ncbi:O-antigen ligase family protein [Patescibacteria group bacterium]|nr:O-antigen ligase family protein [Patescibacteria group bacterium]MCL5010461.1 O-antigen ligase family protein [Patescibacteria group bacterium]
MLKICNKIIEYSFYILFLFVPLAFASMTSELFEFNKMWLTFILTIIITGAWLSKMVIRKRLILQRTPLDIPILLFLASQIISTFHSLDTHVSLWGYYSRFNGGLLSIISYILLYYAFVSNFAYEGTGQATTGAVRIIPMAKRLLKISLISGLIVALWGLPSHFGYDPTCLLFRGTFDVSCWTSAFQPKIRIFSTLGQPDWLAAYLAILIPISIILFIQKTQTDQQIGKPDSPKNRNSGALIIPILRVFRNPISIFYLLLSFLFYLDLIFTGSKSGFLGFWTSIIVFAVYLLFVYGKKRIRSSILAVLIILAGLSIVTFIAGQPFPNLNKFTLSGIAARLSEKPTAASQQPAAVHSGELGGTDSGKIRLIVWKGALDIWRHNPIFGTGVETFAFAYYQYKPKAHNLTSEWDFLYNKAHNEYLNYLATTGAFGLGTYLLMIGWFLFISLSPAAPNLFASLRSGLKNLSQTGSRNKLGITENTGITENNILGFSLIASYISILTTNFFGFSVVITNIYLFMIPGFVFVLLGILPGHGSGSGLPHREREGQKNPAPKKPGQNTSLLQEFLILIIAAVGLYFIWSLAVFWVADTNYAMGYNLDHANEYQRAYPLLRTAVSQRPGEPVFQDELSQNEATLALLSAENKQATQAALLAKSAIEASSNVIKKHPNDVVFWKNRTRVFYILSRLNPAYLATALESLKKAYALAPTDVKVSYDLGVLYGQEGNDKKAVAFLEHTIYIKPDYTNAYYALGLFYHDMALDKKGRVVNRALQNKAVAQMKKILTKLAPGDVQAEKTLRQWQNQ